MMKKHVIGFLMGILLVTGQVWKNEVHAQSKCGYDEYFQHIQATDPQQARKIQSTLEDIYQNRNGRYLKSTEKVTIPVVVHVIYHAEVENISDEQVRSQIEVLTKDFQRLNVDTFKTNPVFKPVAGGMPVEFKLAVRDPEGNPTTGITRTYTDKINFVPGDFVCYDTTGGKDAWPAEDYLNIWVCNFQAGAVLGFASSPGTDPSQDGIVIKYSAFGTKGKVESPQNLGRTATHELGHWFGLDHTFAGGCTNPDLTDCATTGDRICDTPPAAEANYACRLPENTCTEASDDLPDQIENYMDYTYDRCVNMFTRGQVEVMMTTLSTYRQQLKISAGCTPVVENDAGVEEVKLSGSTLCAPSFSPTVKLTNYGSKTLQSARIQCMNESNVLLDYTWEGNLASLESEIIVLDKIEIPGGTNQITFYTSQPNGIADEFFSNDSIATKIKVTSTDPKPLPFVENFENNIFPPIGWDYHNPDIGLTWTLQTTGVTGMDNAPTNAVMLNYYNYDIMGEEDELVTPLIDLSDVQYPELVYDYAFAAKSNEDYLSYSSLQTFVSTNCEEYVLLDEISGKDMKTISSAETTNWQPHAANEWKQRHIDLSPFAGEHISIKFRARNGMSNNLFLDNVSIAEQTNSSANDFRENTISAFPNPVQGEVLYFSFDGTTSEDILVRIYSTTGTLVLQSLLEGNSHRPSLNVSGLNNGIYTVQLSGATHSSYHKVLIQR